MLFLSAEEKTIKDRWMLKNEAEEVPEDQQETISADIKAVKEQRQTLIS